MELNLKVLSIQLQPPQSHQYLTASTYQISTFPSVSWIQTAMKLLTIWTTQMWMELMTSGARGHQERIRKKPRNVVTLMTSVWVVIVISGSIAVCLVFILLGLILKFTKTMASVVRQIGVVSQGYASTVFAKQIASLIQKKC